MERQPTLPQPPKNMPQDIVIPLSNTHFVFVDSAMGNNQEEVYRDLEILFRATLQDEQGNIINNWDEINTWDNHNQYRLNLPQQVIYKRLNGPAVMGEPLPPTSYEGYAINEVVIARNSEDELEHWTTITGTEQDKALLHRGSAGGPEGSAYSGRSLKQANIIEVAQAEAAVASIGPVNVQQLTSWDNIKF